MNLSSKCSKCGEIFSLSATILDSREAVATFDAWRKELAAWREAHMHAAAETAPQTREPARGPGRPKKAV